MGYLNDFPLNSADGYHILYCKGGAEDIGLMEKWLRIMALTLKCTVWSFDYCGFGMNEGTPSTDLEPFIHEWEPVFRIIFLFRSAVDLFF